MTETCLTEKRLLALAAVAVLALLGAGMMIFLYAPQDALQGPVQRIFYVHVSSIVSAYFCFGLTVAGSAYYLWRGALWADRWARCGALVGLVLTSVCLLLGIIWAKPIWNWDPAETWDARFTSTVVLWVLYAGYLLLRKFAPPGRTAMRLAAVVGIVAFVDVPIVYFSVEWWRTLHPGPIIETHALPAAMMTAYTVTQAAMLLLTLTLVLARYRIEAVRDARADDAAQAAMLELSAEGSRS
jgi:heme exporter protein C